MALDPQQITISLWQHLHQQTRHQPRYPSEHVIRYLAHQGHGAGRRALDIGCGYGRHLKALTDHGWNAEGIDTSVEILTSDLHDCLLHIADMTALPYPDNTFHLAIAYGTYYYGTRQDHKQAVAELHRVLKPNGHALISHRSTSDSRYRTGTPKGQHTCVVTVGAEKGMTMNFLTDHDIFRDYAQFDQITYERTATTRDQRRWVDSDLLITVQK